MTEHRGTHGEHNRGNSVQAHTGISAIVWDYDGTLVDTATRNLQVTRTIVRTLAGHDAHDFPALQSREQYAAALARSVNWREFYRNAFRFSDAEVDEAGSRWTEFQMRDRTPTPVYDGIREVLARLSDIPQGIVSQNSREVIRETLDANDLSMFFGSIVGYEEVGLQRQKPAPDGLLRCIEVLTKSSGGHVLYIGDHPTDAVCARDADAILRRARPPTRVSSVAALYASHHGTPPWSTRPDFAAREVADLVRIVETLSTPAGHPASGQ